MATTSRLRPISHDDQLTLVEHLDELRTRLLVALAAFVVAFSFCFWQRDLLLGIINEPLQQSTAHSAARSKTGPLESNARLQQRLRTTLDAVTRSSQATEGAVRALAAGRPVTPAEQRALAALGASNAELARSVRDTIAVLPRGPTPRQPLTLGVAEPFSATLTVATYGALLLSLPVILWQLYAFLLPAFSPRERRVALPVMLAVPLLFVAGVVFGYFTVLPAALRFLQNFNDGAFDIQVQARDYFRFCALTLMAMGLVFQIPVAVVGATRTGVVTTRQIRNNHGYAIVVIAVIAMLLPGTDPVSMLVAMVPLLVLFEASILISSVLDRRKARAEAEAAAGAEQEDDLLLHETDDD
jgi:sec-independent protein translocase protein TatC